MTKFTQEDLVQYLYKETSAQKTADITIALENDWILRDCFEQISHVLKTLDEVNISPREEVVNTILHHTPKNHSELHHY